MATLPAWKTVAQVVSDAAIELGLTPNDIADPFASTDPIVLQLLRLLRSGGRALAQHRNWHGLQKEYTFVSAAATEAYALPSDFRSMVDDSQWNRTTQFPVAGPISGQQWQALKARNITSTIAVLFRIWQGQIYLRNPSDNQTIAFEYQSSSWVQPNGQASPTLDAPTAKDDVVCFGSTLIVARLKRDFRRTKKQPSDSEEDDYARALYAAENDDSQGATIYLGAHRSSGFRRADALNLPETIG